MENNNNTSVKDSLLETLKVVKRNHYTAGESDSKFAAKDNVNSIEEKVKTIGTLTDLTTTDKSSIVNAINEINSTLDDVASILDILNGEVL